MRPLVHPPIEDVTVEGILHALSDRVRVRIVEAIVTSGASSNCSNFLDVGDRRIPKSTLSQHLRILRDSGLIRSERRGVEMHNTPRSAEIDTRFPYLIATILKAYKLQSEGKRQVVTTPRLQKTRKPKILKLEV